MCISEKELRERAENDEFLAKCLAERDECVEAIRALEQDRVDVATDEYRAIIKDGLGENVTDDDVEIHQEIIDESIRGWKVKLSAANTLVSLASDCE